MKIIENIDDLLKKYKAGGRPPLNELVNDELLKIFQRGAVGKRLSSFGVLLPSLDEPSDSQDRWLNGKFINIAANWTEHCKTLRTWKNKCGNRTYNAYCDECDRQHAYLAAEQMEPIIYICNGGMVDYAFPIVVDGHTVAVLFAGQEFPVEGEIWSNEIIEKYSTQNNISGSADARKECMARNEKIMKEMAIDKPEEKIPNLIELAKEAPPICPEDVPNVLEEMKKASEQLSHLAERTVGYQLNIIRGYFTSKVAQLLPENDIQFWNGFSDFLSEIAIFYERDYAFFYMLKRVTDDFMILTSATTKDILREKILMVQKQQFFPLKNVESCEPFLLKPADAKKQLFNDTHFFDSPCYIIPLEVNGPLGLIVMGNFDRKGGYKLISREIELVKEQFQDISIILENRRQLLARDIYVTDLSHEIKSPLAAVLFSAKNLLAGRVGDDQIASRIEEIITRLRRLRMNIDRFGMLETLLSSPDSLKPKAVSVYDVAKECEKEYKDLADERNMAIEVKKELQSLPTVYTNREAFKHALGNIVHNAVKYGDPHTEVIIEGRMAGTEIKIDVGDIGIPILPEHEKMLGQRNFRSIDARKIDPAGTGIGFTIIDRFLKITGGRVEVKSEQSRGQSHHVIISMFLPKYGVPQWQKY